MIADLVRGFLNPSFVSDCDFTKLERCNGSYVTDDLREREDDIIWKLAYGDRTLILYLLLEFQSKPDNTMPVRIMSYMALLWQDLIRTGVIVPSDKLPALFLLFSITGSSPGRCHKHSGDYPDARACQQFVPSVPYLLIDELRLSVHHLIEVRNLAACLFGLEQSSGPEELFEFGEKLNRWMETDPDLESMRRDFSLYFESTLKRDEDRSLSNPFQGGNMLAERVNKWIAEYKAEGKAEGRLEERISILKRMKKAGLSVSDMSQITGLSEDEIRHII
jgi:hypothetical protein